MGKFIHTFVVALLVTTGLSVVGCGGGSGSPGTPTSPSPARSVVSVSVLGPNSLQTGEPANFTARAKWSDGADEDVTAQASWGAIPAGVASTAGGVVTAATPGNLQVTASFSGVSGVMQVVVAAPAPVPTVRGSLTIESVSVPNGANLSYTKNGAEPELQVLVGFDFTSDAGESVYMTTLLGDDTAGQVIWHTRNQVNLGSASRRGGLTLRPSMYVSGAQGITRTTKVMVFLTKGDGKLWDATFASPYAPESEIKGFVAKAERSWTLNWR